jgi:hypothetical protein
MHEGWPCQSTLVLTLPALASTQCLLNRAALEARLVVARGLQNGERWSGVQRVVFPFPALQCVFQGLTGIERKNHHTGRIFDFALE